MCHFESQRFPDKIIRGQALLGEKSPSYGWGISQSQNRLFDMTSFQIWKPLWV